MCSDIPCGDESFGLTWEFAALNQCVSAKISPYIPGFSWANLDPLLVFLSLRYILVTDS